MICDIDTAIGDPRLLGAALGDLKTWAGWRVILRAAFGLPLTPDQLVIFKDLAGGREPPKARVAELWIVAGRRGGKSRMAAAISVYLAAFAEEANQLAVGETGHILVLAPSKDQAGLVKGYAAGHFAASPILEQEVESESASEIRLRGNITLGVHTNSFRTVRGRTLIGCIFEELAFWRSEDSASPDYEVYRAILPALASTGGMLIGISSPYRRAGLLYEKFRDHFGESGDVLVIQAPTEKLNPKIDKGIIARALESDTAAGLSEWMAEWRSDIAALLDDAVIEQAIDRSRPLELPPTRGTKYWAFTDASAGRHDAFAVGIAHLHDDKIVVDVIRGIKPPFDPHSVAIEFAKLARSYDCTEIVGDNYSGDWVANAFRSAGIGYRRSDLTRSELYLEMLPVFNRHGVSIPNNTSLIRELKLLERRTSRSGRDSIDHPAHASDDLANVLGGVINLAVKKRQGVRQTRAGKVGYTHSQSRKSKPKQYRQGGYR